MDAYKLLTKLSIDLYTIDMLTYPTIRINRRSHQVLRALARESHRSMQQVLDAAIERERRQAFFQGINDGYAKLRADPKAWAEYQAEFKVWDVTLMDGLDPNER